MTQSRPAIRSLETSWTVRTARIHTGHTCSFVRFSFKSRSGDQMNGDSNSSEDGRRSFLGSVVDRPCPPPPPPPPSGKFGMSTMRSHSGVSIFGSLLLHRAAGQLGAGERASSWIHGATCRRHCSLDSERPVEAIAKPTVLSCRNLEGVLIKF